MAGQTLSGARCTRVGVAGLGLLLLGSACADTHTLGPDPLDAGEQELSGSGGSQGAAGTLAGQAGLGAAGASTVLDGGTLTESGSGGRPGPEGGPHPSGDAGNGIPEPLDASVRANRDPWVPPTLASEGQANWSADIGWRDSTDAICHDKVGQPNAHAVYSTADAVYALVSLRCNLFDGDCGDQRVQGTSVYRNDGEGWQELYRVSNAHSERLWAYPDGRILSSGRADSCGLLSLGRAGQSRCLLDGPVADVSIVDEDTTYVLRFDRVLAGDGVTFEELTPPLGPADAVNATDLFAADGYMVVAGSAQSVWLRATEDTDWEQLQGVPQGDYRAVWAFAPDDIWIGSAQGELVHYDGDRWQTMWSASDCAHEGIHSLWGAEDGTLYFATEAHFGRWAEGQVELLSSWECQPDVGLVGLWGNAADEVFLSVVDRRRGSMTCGQGLLFWFDGSEIRRF